MVVKAAVAVAGLAIAAVGTAKTISSQKKMVREQRKAQQFERQKQDLQSMRQRLEVVRSTRSARANAQQVAENQGVADSSSAQGGQGSIVSQGTGNLSFLDQYGFLSDQAGEALNRAMKHQGNASMWNSVAGVGASMYSMSGGLGSAPSGGGGGGGGHVGPAPPTSPTGAWWNGGDPFGTFGGNG